MLKIVDLQAHSTSQSLRWHLGLTKYISVDEIKRRIIRQEQQFVSKHCARNIEFVIDIEDRKGEREKSIMLSRTRQSLCHGHILSMFGHVWKCTVAPV